MFICFNEWFTVVWQYQCLPKDADNLLNKKNSYNSITAFIIYYELLWFILSVDHTQTSTLKYIKLNKSKLKLPWEKQNWPSEEETTQGCFFLQHTKMAVAVSGAALSFGILLYSAFRHPFLGAYGLNHSAGFGQEFAPF